MIAARREPRFGPSRTAREAVMEVPVAAWVVSAVLLIASMTWMARHIQLWNRARETVLDERELDFRRRQFGRRMQTSGLMAVLAVAMFAGCWITRPPLLVLFYWLVVVGLTAWLMLLAAADMLATRIHFARMEDECKVAQSRLRSQLRQIRGQGDSGDSD